MKEKCVLWAVVYLLTGLTNLKCEESTESFGNLTDASRTHYSWSAPLILKNNRIFTKVSVNGGKEQNFWVDNGWSQTTVDSRLPHLLPQT